jgi:hypothetical protein
MYRMTLWCIHITIVAVETQCNFVCFLHYVIKGVIFRKKNNCFDFIYYFCVKYFSFQEEFRELS